jgi:hypothetical protein
MSRRLRGESSYNFFGSQPGGSSITPTRNNPGIFLPWGTENIGVAEAATAIGVANQQQFWQFVPSYNVQIGHVVFNVSTPLAASKCGIAIYSGDLTTKLTAADATDCTAGGVKSPALSSIITLLQNTAYWLGFVVTDATTLIITNFLGTTVDSNLKNRTSPHDGRDTVDATAGGVTLAAPVNIANITNLQLRVPLLWFEL